MRNEVNGIMQQSDIIRFRTSVENRLGDRVRIRMNKGRRRADVKEGVLKEAYRSIFTVEVDHGSAVPQVLSFSYTDVLTDQVQMILC